MDFTAVIEPVPEAKDLTVTLESQQYRTFLSQPGQGQEKLWKVTQKVRFAEPVFITSFKYMSLFKKTVVKKLNPITHISPWFHSLF